MFTKIVFRLTTNVAGDGDTGQAANITFLKSPYSYPTDVIAGITVTEIGTTACYVATGFTTFQLAKIFVSGVERTAYSEQVSGDLVTYLAANYGRLASNNTWTGQQTFNNDVIMGDLLNMGGFDIHTLPASPGGTTSAIRLDYADARYWMRTNKVFAPTGNVLFVDYSLASDIAGVAYNTIQEAIDYAQTQTPSGSSRWTIYIYPHKNNSSITGYVENLTFYKYIDLIGLGTVLVKGGTSYSGTWTGGTFAKMENIVIAPADDVGIIIRGWEVKNCHFMVSEDTGGPTIYTENSQFENCGFWQKNTVTTLITSTNNSTFTNCSANDDVSAMISAGDEKFGGFGMVDDVTKYFKIT